MKSDLVTMALGIAILVLLALTLLPLGQEPTRGRAGVQAAPANNGGVEHRQDAARED